MRKHKFTIALTLVLSAMYAGATHSPSPPSDSKPKIDTKKYCYYESLEYSEGSRLKQAGELLICKKLDSGHLVWESEG